MHEVSEFEDFFKSLRIEFNCMVSTMMIPRFMSECRVFNLSDVRRGCGETLDAPHTQQGGCSRILELGIRSVFWIFRIVVTARLS